MNDDPFEYDDEPTEPYGGEGFNIKLLAGVAAAALVAMALLVVWALWGHKP